MYVYRLMFLSACICFETDVFDSVCKFRDWCFFTVYVCLETYVFDSMCLFRD